MPVIEIRGLRKEYRRLRGGSTVAVDGLDLEVPEGGVYGFLGPNGAGKTTTIRCLLGLVRPTAGTCRVLGADARSGLSSVIRRIGSIVETPALFPGMTARRNLRLLGRLDDIGPARVDAVLERVGLSGRADDLVKNYSLGMKQRLGIGAALLRDPELLVLDEPANGLDPAGIVEVRDLLRSLGAEGRTVFVSSHLLGEVQQTSDRVAILARGKAVASGPVDEVLSQGRISGVVVRVRNRRRALPVLRAAGFEARQDGELIRVATDPGRADRVTRALADEGLYAIEIRPDAVNLEQVFLELTSEPQQPE